MLQINPTQNNQLVKSVQRDYYQRAETHRLLKATNGQRPIIKSLQNVVVQTRYTYRLIVPLFALLLRK